MTREYSTCPCCNWTLKNGKCDACGQDTNPIKEANMSELYTVEIDGGQIVGNYPKKEAYDVARSYQDKFGVHVHVYPQEPEGIGPQPKQMCEVCGERVAEPGDFICMDCISRMLVDMDSSETDKY